MSQEPAKDDRTVMKDGAGGTSRPATRWEATVNADAPASPQTVADDSHELPVGTRLGEFEINGLVGEGGFSIVYLAWDHSLERKVALKEYMPSSLASRSGQSRVIARSERHKETFDLGLKSFINEGKLLAQFDHPALVKVYRFWEANGTAYMVMPLYEGVTLKDAVRAMPQPPDEAWLRGLLDPLTEALAVIHREQCFHRDIAPDNVMLLAPSHKPLLLDFGAARRVIGDRTQALTVILKPGYAPVEQYAEDSAMKQGPWTDVYALAAVVHWAITGKTPPVSVGRMVNDSYVPLARSAAGRYGAAFLEAIDRALEVLPQRRTRSIEAFRNQLGLGAGMASKDDASPAWVDPEATRIQAPPAQRHPATQPVTPRSPTASGSALPTPLAAPDRGASSAAEQAGPARKLPAAAIGIGATLMVTLAVGYWAMREPAPESAPPQAKGLESPPSMPAAPAPPALPSATLDAMLAGRDPSIEVSASVQAPSAESVATTARVSYKASESGYAYMFAADDKAGRLLQLHPPVATTAKRVAPSGDIDIGTQAWQSGAARLVLVVAREPRMPAAPPWGPPDCAGAASACDAAFGAVEVRQETNFIPAPAAAAPPVPPKTERAGAAPAQKPQPQAAAPEARPRPQRSADNAAECARILQHVSLGESSPELIERLKTLRCG